MTEISFEFECFEPFGDVDVWVECSSGAILIFSSLSGDEIDFDLLSDSDKSRIKALAKEHLDYHKDMESQPLEPHPADSEFGPDYVNWINSEANK